MSLTSVRPSVRPSVRLTIRPSVNMSVPDLCLKYRPEYFDDTSQLCIAGHADVSRTKMRALSLILYELSPFDAFYAYLCPLCHLRTLRNIITMLHSYVEQIVTMCHIQD